MQQYEIVKSYSFDQQEILRWICQLHCQYIDVDLTFGKGDFYKDSEGYIHAPEYSYDINPQYDYVEKRSSDDIDFSDGTVHSIVFDPPFMFGNHGKQSEYSATKKYTMFKDFESLKGLYQRTLKEAYRVLEPNGILIFKCQDFTDNKTTMTHSLVYNWAVENGFYAKDVFILLTNFKILNTQIPQRHSRKFHSYFWVFEKKNHVIEG